MRVKILRRGRERARCRRQYTAEFIESTFTDCNFIGRPTRCRTVLADWMRYGSTEVQLRDLAKRTAWAVRPA